ncbi:MAG: glycosyltransferase [Pirellulales bacterium]|nr:glycosyltransferase [Pirellulales bacterium]
MKYRHRELLPIEQRGPLRVAFVTTALNVGGEETLLANIIRRMDRRRFAPELVCLKQLGVLGDQLVVEVPAFNGLLQNKFDLRVLARLTQLFRERQTDAVVTVGTGGDKMFWGRLAAWRAGVPVIASALHSTGLPNRVEFSNRLLAPLTDAFIAVAEAHGCFLASDEGCAPRKIRVIPNGVDTSRFCDRPGNDALRAELGLPVGAPTVGIVAVLRPEKNHDLFLRAAAIVHRTVPEARFLIVGDGPLRPEIEAQIHNLGLAGIVHMLGMRRDIPELLHVIDVVALTSKMEANPVSVLEALSSGRPVVSTRVGSIPENVIDGETGFLVPPGDEQTLAARLTTLLTNPQTREYLGRAARERIVRHASLESMVGGYERLIAEIYSAKTTGRRWTNERDSSASPPTVHEVAPLTRAAAEVVAADER